MPYEVPEIEISEKMYLDELDGEDVKEADRTWVMFQRPSRAERIAVSKKAADVETHFREGDQTWYQKAGVPQSELDDVRMAYALVDSNIMRAKKLLFVSGKTCREAHKPLTDDQYRAFMQAWRQLPDPEVTEPILRALREFHPPYDWRNPQRGED